MSIHFSATAFVKKQKQQQKEIKLSARSESENQPKGHLRIFF